MRRDGVVIAGGGLAAQRCCETLRTAGYDGRIVMVCAEQRPPYDRPPLSKELLAGTRAPDTLGFRPAAWYDDAGVELRLGVAARRLDPGTRTLELGDGERLVYDRLLVATGARPRRLAALDGYDNVLALRDADDAPPAAGLPRAGRAAGGRRRGLHRARGRLHRPRAGSQA